MDATQQPMNTRQRLASVAAKLVETSDASTDFLDDLIVQLKKSGPDGRNLALKLGCHVANTLNVLALGVAQLALDDLEDDDDTEDGPRDEGDDLEEQLVPTEAAQRLRDAPFALRVALVRALAADIRDDMETHAAGMVSVENAHACRQNAELLDEVTDSLAEMFGVYAEGHGGGT